MVQIHHVAATTCPNCGTVLDAATPIDGKDGKPTPGDFTICIGCSALLVYETALNVRLLSANEFLALSIEERKGLAYAQHAVTAVRTKRIQSSQPIECCYCDQSFAADSPDIRPYGPKGAWTCYACAHKPENRATTKQECDRHIAGAMHAGNGIILGDNSGPMPLNDPTKPFS